MRLLLLLAALLSFQITSASEINELLLEAQSGDDEAMFQLAVHLEESLMKAEDIGGYVDILKNPFADNGTKGLLTYRNETGWDEVEGWYLQSAKGGNLKAMTRLGEGKKHESGGFERDISWLVEAAISDYPPAQFKLGLNYLQGKMLKDTPRAHKWLKKASDNGYSNASAAIGNSLSDKTEALVYLKKAYSQGMLSVSLTVAGMLASTPNKDLAEAQSWSDNYIKFVSGGNSTSRKEGSLALSIATELSNGLKKNDSSLKTIISLYEVSASTRNTTAMMALGDLFAGKKNGIHNMPKALMWYNLAAKRGSKKAAAKYKKIIKKKSKAYIEASNKAATDCRIKSYLNC